MAQQNKDTNELIKVRRQKLADLQAAGKNPFEIMKYDVTHHSKEIKDNFEKLEGKEGQGIEDKRAALNKKIDALNDLLNK